MLSLNFNFFFFFFSFTGNPLDKNPKESKNKNPPKCTYVTFLLFTQSTFCKPFSVTSKEVTSGRMAIFSLMKKIRF